MGRLIRILGWLLVANCARVRADDTPPPTRFEGVEQVVTEAIARGELPGCVVAIGTHRGTVYARAFGERTKGEPMTLDTLFDLASLTKPLATATSALLLAAEGRLDLDQPVARLLPAFARPDKRTIRIRELLLHTSGLAQVGPLAQVEQGHDVAIDRIAAQPLASAPGTRFRYSDLGYLVLGALIEKASGSRLDALASARVFTPLGMRDTHFFVAPRDVARTAPTETRDGRTIRGVVDDPRAYRLGGVAGHAGLFSTAEDVARFARALLSGGVSHVSADGRVSSSRTLPAQVVAQLLDVEPVPGARRTLGFDAESPYAHGRGTLLSAHAVGHGGYTGTSLWLDPARDLFVVLLSNRVHAGPRGTIHPLASSVADIAVRALSRESPRGPRVGIDVLAGEAFARLRGRKVALLTHLAARDQRDRSTLDRLAAAPGLKLQVVLTPEHGLAGDQEGPVASRPVHGLTVHSLFGKTRRPTPEMLDDVDTVVIDLVDVGTRFYTYMATALATIEVASTLDLPVFLLDRPNPLDGVHVEGPVSEPAFASFVNYAPLPLRHGMTAGELARLLHHERGLRGRLHIVRVEGWDRTRWAGSLGRAWHPPSPNLKTPEQALLYPAIGLVEGTNLSVGRGGTRAFRVVGAPFVDARLLTQALREETLCGVEVEATRFRPSRGPHHGARVGGIALHVSDPGCFSAARTGMALIRALFRLCSGSWDTTRLDRMVANRATMHLLEAGAPQDAIEASWRESLQAFEQRRRAFLLY